MTFVIDVPDILPVNFGEPTAELSCFLHALEVLCVHLSERFRTVQDRRLFSAFICNGSSTVFCTEDQSTQAIRYDEARDASDKVTEDYDEDAWAEDEGFPEDYIVMAADVPGNWVVARLYVEGWPEGDFITLRSSDFEGDPPMVRELFGRVGRHLAKRAHRVPSAGQ